LKISGKEKEYKSIFLQLSLEWITRKI